MSWSKSGALGLAAATVGLCLSSPARANERQIAEFLDEHFGAAVTLAPGRIVRRADWVLLTLRQLKLARPDLEASLTGIEVRSSGPHQAFVLRKAGKVAMSADPHERSARKPARGYASPLPRAVSVERPLRRGTTKQRERKVVRRGTTKQRERKVVAYVALDPSGRIAQIHDHSSSVAQLLSAPEHADPEVHRNPFRVLLKTTLNGVPVPEHSGVFAPRSPRKHYRTRLTRVKSLPQRASRPAAVSALIRLSRALRRPLAALGMAPTAAEVTARREARHARRALVAERYGYASSDEASQRNQAEQIGRAQARLRVRQLAVLGQALDGLPLRVQNARKAFFSELKGVRVRAKDLHAMRIRRPASNAFSRRVSAFAERGRHTERAASIAGVP